jgi:DNA-binding response OmpR family regulator
VVILDDATDVASTTHRIGYLRRRWPTLLVAVVNAARDARVTELLDAGADEAIVTGSPACVPRLRAIARRARMVNASTRIGVGDVVFEREARRVWCAGREVELSPREFAVLDCLFWKAPATVSTEALVDYVWGDAETNGRRGVAEVYIGYLRKKLAASRQVVIGTVRGEGYRFEPRG